MEPGEKLCLKWNDFQESLQTAFAELRGGGDFTDVTLACEDKTIKAHKVILSAGNPFFKRLLKTHTNPQPLIYMRDRGYFLSFSDPAQLIVSIEDVVHTNEPYQIQKRFFQEYNLKYLLFFFFKF